MSRDFWAFIALAIGIMVAIVLMVSSAKAESDWCRLHSVGCDAEIRVQRDGTRVYAWRRTDKPTHRRIRIDRDRDREDRREAREFGFVPGPNRHALCLAPVSVVGSQHVTENGAEESAVKGWAEQVRFSHGEQFMDINSAEGYAKRCTRSSIGELAGQMLHRCQLVARPCRPALSIKEDGK
jgi:hypothetical protein